MKIRIVIIIILTIIFYKSRAQETLGGRSEIYSFNINKPPEVKIIRTSEGRSDRAYYGIRKSKLMTSMFNGEKQTGLTLDSLLPDKTPPTIEILSPDVSRGFKLYTEKDEINLKIKVDDDTEVFEVLINEHEVIPISEGKYEITLIINNDNELISIQAKDLYENVTVKQLVVEKKEIIKKY